MIQVMHRSGVLSIIAGLLLFGFPKRLFRAPSRMIWQKYMNRKFTLPASLCVVFSVAVSGCSVKLGSTSYRQDSVESAAEGVPYELELRVTGRSSPDISISFANQNFVWAPDVTLKDIDITWRHHFGRIAKTLPYAGVGYGNFRLKSSREVDTCPPGYICYGDWSKTVSSTLAKGYNPHLVAGLEIPLSGRTSLIFEDKYEMSKEDNGTDFSSNILYLGLKWGMF
jgi:hypothetical protein